MDHKKIQINKIQCDCIIYCEISGVGNSPADNYSTGGIISRIDIKTGMLGRAFSLYPVYGKYEFQIHPDTGQQIEGATLPDWKKLLKFTLDVHSRFKTVFVGWDVCKTEQGFCVIEGNIGWTACGYEIPHHKPFSNTDYPELYEKWMDKFLQNTEA